MIQAIEFSTVISDNQHIDIPTDFHSQLKANQAVRVIVLVDEFFQTNQKRGGNQVF